jgi:glycosyltransferase involved in cell wall biosynthesis
LGSVKVSVIIPIYNGASHILDCLKSVLLQDFSDYEVLIINDGSTDATHTLCTDFIASNYLVGKFQIITIPNSGVSSARNIGLLHASGDYVAFLDSDDLWLPEKLSSQILFMENNPDFLGCVTSFLVFNDAHKFGHKTLRLISHKDLASLKHGWLSLEGNGGLISSTLLFRNEHRIEFDLGLSTAADLDFFFKLCEKGQIATLRDPLVKYRIHKNQMHRNAAQFLNDYQLLISQIHDPIIVSSRDIYLGNAFAMAAMLEFSSCSYRRAVTMVFKSLSLSPLSVFRIPFFVGKKRFFGIFSRIQKFFTSPRIGKEI